MLRQLIVLAGALVLAALGAAGGTAAPRAEQIHIALDESFVGRTIERSRVPLFSSRPRRIRS